MSWTWSEQYRNYYCVQQDESGNYVYLWAETGTTQHAPITQDLPLQATNTVPLDIRSSAQHAYNHAESTAPQNTLTPQGTRPTHLPAQDPHLADTPLQSQNQSQQDNFYPVSQPYPYPTSQPLQSTQPSQYSYRDVQHARADSGTSHFGRQYLSIDDQANLTQAPTSNDAILRDANTQDQVPTDLELPASVPEEERRQILDLIPGTPGNGWREALDPSYRMRTGREAYKFFKVGRVFSMLYTEAAGGTAVPNGDCFTEVRLGGCAHTQIRRFVIVKVQHGFVYACAIFTYNGQGTNKRGCVPSEHTIVYCPGTDPATCYMAGERERGMTKDPLKIIPADSSLTITRASRLRLSKTYPVEMNVKVKDIGEVDPTHASTLLSYWEQEFRS